MERVRVPRKQFIYDSIEMLRMATMPLWDSLARVSTSHRHSCTDFAIAPGVHAHAMQLSVFEEKKMENPNWDAFIQAIETNRDRERNASALNSSKVRLLYRLFGGRAWHRNSSTLCFLFARLSFADCSMFFFFNLSIVWPQPCRMWSRLGTFFLT